MKSMIFKSIKYLLVAASLLTVVFSATAQTYTLPNETVIFSFKIANGKKVTLNKDKNNQYIIYRFGTNNKIEWEFPGRAKDSWQSFTYSFYLRGGGIQNEAMDLNYFYFTNKGFKYVLYHTYVAVGGKQRIGVKVINLITHKTIDIKGKIKTRKGSLIDFRDNGLVTIGDELYD